MERQNIKQTTGKLSIASNKTAAANRLKVAKLLLNSNYNNHYILHHYILHQGKVNEKILEQLIL
jgi:hypothetical protein